MYYVYVLKSEVADEIYIGSTNNLHRRLSEHNNGVEISTKRYKPWSIIYYEAYKTEKLARLREKRLKQHGNAMKELKKRIGLHPAPPSKRSGANERVYPAPPSKRSGAGFTLIELIISISIIAILLGATVVLINPVAQFANARNSERLNHLNVIMNALKQNAADNRGIFTCSAGLIPTSTTILGTSGYDIDSCIAPDYIAVLPVDPSTGTSTDIGYSIISDAATGRITITADDAELGKVVSIIR